MTIKAGNLTISVPHFNRECNKHCPYCISRMTGNVEEDFNLFKANMEKVKYVAKQAGIQNVLLTGKKEPLLDQTNIIVKDLTEEFYPIPVELQTNGINLNRNTIDILFNSGINVIGISVDGIQDIRKQFDNLLYLDDLGIVTRFVVNLSTKTLEQSNHQTSTWLTINEIIEYCQEQQVNQLTMRKLTYPPGAEETSEAKWIIENSSNHSGVIQMEEEFVRTITKNGTWIRTLNHGDVVYDLDGLSVVFNSYCIQDYDHESNVRSLIYLPDGHLYTNWNSPASILF